MDSYARATNSVGGAYDKIQLPENLRRAEIEAMNRVSAEREELPLQIAGVRHQLRFQTA